MNLSVGIAGDSVSVALQDGRPVVGGAPPRTVDSCVIGVSDRAAAMLAWNGAGARGADDGVRFGFREVGTTHRMGCEFSRDGGAAVDWRIDSAAGSVSDDPETPEALRDASYIL